MPRSGTTYSLPVAPFVFGTPILPADMNSNLSDIATALTDSFTRAETTTYSRTLLDDATAAAARTTLGVGAAPDVISEVVAASATTIDFTGLDSTYDRLELELTQLVPSTDDVVFGLRFGTGSGPTWIASAGAYGACGFAAAVGGTAATGSASLDSIPITPSGLGAGTGAGNAAGESTSGLLRFSRPSATVFPLVSGQVSMVRADGLPQDFRFTGRLNSAGPITALRIIVSAGAISGTARLIGYRKP